MELSKDERDLFERFKTVSNKIWKHQIEKGESFNIVVTKEQMEILQNHNFIKPQLGMIKFDKPTQYSFVVSAQRWGNDNNHSYVVGIFDDEKIAIECANKHKIYRGGKYECIVEKFKTNHYDEETALENNEIIYKTIK